LTHALSLLTLSNTQEKEKRRKKKTLVINADSPCNVCNRQKMSSKPPNPKIGEFDLGEMSGRLEIPQSAKGMQPGWNRKG
jgi:hypothetical protein